MQNQQITANNCRKDLLLPGFSGKILIRDTLNSLLPKLKAGARDHKEGKQL